MALGAEDTSEPTAHSIEQIAEVYEQELSARAPTGPLVVGGFSFGALPAFELARRLIGHGREVPLLRHTSRATRARTQPADRARLAA